MVEATVGKSGFMLQGTQVGVRGLDRDRTEDKLASLMSRKLRKGKKK